MMLCASLVYSPKRDKEVGFILSYLTSSENKLGDNSNHELGDQRENLTK
uniref:Uncharacterized protein n=1 Tax=Nelumbo nucifera TaxID=4432 RepID=A0A822YRT8_NELNU|nr:TPA_asm: hypothetical protein HUJ06_005870 [Nelumbo nucifera]